MSTDTNKAKPIVVRQPVVTSVIALSADFAERGVTTSFELMQEARSEIKSVADATINYADSLTKTAFEFARATSAHLNRFASAGIDQSKDTLLIMIGAARNTGARMSALAAGTVGDMVGSKPGSDNIAAAA
ncbi:MAG: hypothetical protein AAGC55_30350 [Myxococcota bacterium]